jgi:hypothetical protein
MNQSVDINWDQAQEIWDSIMKYAQSLYGYFRV